MDFRRIYHADRGEIVSRRKRAIIDDATWRYRTSPMVYGFRSDVDGGEYYQLVEVDGRLVRQPITGVVENRLIDCTTNSLNPPPGMKPSVRVTYAEPAGEVVTFPESARVSISLERVAPKSIDGPLRELLMFDAFFQDVPPVRLPPTLERLMINSWNPVSVPGISGWSRLTRLTHLVLPRDLPVPIDFVAPDLEELSIGIDRLPKEVWPTFRRLRAVELRGEVDRLDLSYLPQSIEFLRLEITTAFRWTPTRFRRVDLRHLTRLRRVELDVGLYEGSGDAIFDWPETVTELSLLKRHHRKILPVWLDRDWLPPKLKRLTLGYFDINLDTLPPTLEQIDLSRYPVLTRKCSRDVIASFGVIGCLTGFVSCVIRGSNSNWFTLVGGVIGTLIGLGLYRCDRSRIQRSHRILTSLPRVTVPQEAFHPPEWNVQVVDED